MISAGEAGRVKSQNPKVAPDPRDLVLPRDAEIRGANTYTVPYEFWDASQSQFVGLDASPKFFNILNSKPEFFDTVLSLGGLAKKPRNVVDFFSHPWDYASGNIEQTMVSSPAPQEYSMVDNDWTAGQNMATAGSILFSLLASAWAGSKNVDGSGRIPLWKMINVDPETGRRSMGALPLTAIMYSFFLTGGSLAAQYRQLKAEGHSPFDAYITAANPITGWPLTLADRDHAFVDFVHADMVSSAVSLLYGQYVGRLAGMLAVSSYAGFSPDDLVPALNQVAQSKVSELEKARADYLATQKEVKTLRMEQKRLRMRTFAVGNGQSNSEELVRLLRNNKEAITADDHKLKGLNKTIGQLEKWITEFDHALAKPYAVPLNGEEGIALLQTELTRVNAQLVAENSVVSVNLASLERTGTDSAQAVALQGGEHLRSNGAAPLLARRAQELERAIQTLESGGEIPHFRPLQRGDVRTLAKGATQLWRSSDVEGTPLDILEAVRNKRLTMSEAEQAMLAKRSPLARFGYGAVRGFTDGRWRARLTSYGATAAVVYGEVVLTYRFMWDKTWRQSLQAGASIFVSLAVNEPWVGAWKAAGLKKIPYVLQYMPSTIFVNGAWSVYKWDNDVMLQRCKHERSNLLRSQHPEYRAYVRSRLKADYAMASEEEKGLWTKPLSEDGCGMPIPE